MGSCSETNEVNLKVPRSSLISRSAAVVGGMLNVAESPVRKSSFRGTSFLVAVVVALTAELEICQVDGSVTMVTESVLECRGRPLEALQGTGTKLIVTPLSIC